MLALKLCSGVFIELKIFCHQSARVWKRKIFHCVWPFSSNKCNQLCFWCPWNSVCQGSDYLTLGRFWMWGFCVVLTSVSSETVHNSLPSKFKPFSCTIAMVQLQKHKRSRSELWCLLLQTGQNFRSYLASNNLDVCWWLI